MSAYTFKPVPQNSPQTEPRSVSPSLPSQALASCSQSEEEPSRSWNLDERVCRDRGTPVLTGGGNHDQSQQKHSQHPLNLPGLVWDGSSKPRETKTERASERQKKTTQKCRYQHTLDLLKCWPFMANNTPLLTSPPTPQCSGGSR